MKAKVKWQDNLHFRAEGELGHQIDLDARYDDGTISLGPTPVELLLSSVGGCTGMDVISILKKMRQNVTALNLEVSGEKNDGYPQRLKEIHVHFHFEGEIDPAKAAKAIQLSMEQYCTVSNSLGVKVNYSLEVVHHK